MANLVTGGAGFIGANIVDKLIKNGEKTIVVDNLSRGSRENLNDEAEFYEIDIRDQQVLKNVFRKHEIEYVYHQAAQADAVLAQEEPAFDAETNIVGSLNILEMCVEYDVKKVVYASSAAVYGTPTELPLQEEHLAAPESPYGVSKLTLEYYLEIYKEQYDLDYAALRYANVYGPRQFAEGEGGVIAIFITRALNGSPLIVYGDGKQTRDFIYVDDVAEANLKAMTSNTNGVYNISCGKQTSLLKIISLLEDIFDKKLKTSYEAPRSGDIKHSCLNNNKAKNQLDWVPNFNLKKGLENTVKYYKNK
ncbi:NAD-dependent epimerase/dehydratase family protein [Halarsenatibacter silvermanii]|uniref:UDP-glucose 4-epimerase n=1 Tax=Halarsenatibacter silvermanii TaxID=321763 RepID=A0A1G9S9P6_9FIRM|nr:NAD-dependent epimerase/dehydratase family protein [Halarsenatibacter silvermanii]SDM32122.1 UDP-glucose 4-epimerase [Halarsenatibacter silvermanii]